MFRSRVPISVDYMTSFTICEFCEYSADICTIRSRSLRSNKEELEEIRGFDVFHSLMIKYPINNNNRCCPKQNISILYDILSVFEGLS